MSKPRHFPHRHDDARRPGRSHLKGWSVGNGDFLAANNSAVQVASRDDLLQPASRTVWAWACGEIVRPFTDRTRPRAWPKTGLEWTRNEDETNRRPALLCAGRNRQTSERPRLGQPQHSYFIPQIRGPNGWDARAGRHGRCENQGNVEGAEQWKGADARSRSPPSRICSKPAARSPRLTATSKPT